MYFFTTGLKLSHCIGNILRRRFYYRSCGGTALRKPRGPGLEETRKEIEVTTEYNMCPDITCSIFLSRILTRAHLL